MIKKVIENAQLAIDSTIAKKALADGEEISLHEMVQILRKDARQAIKDAGMWNQAFHKNEIVSVIALFRALTAERKNDN